MGAKKIISLIISFVLLITVSFSTCDVTDIKAANYNFTPITGETVPRLNIAGYEVYQSGDTWIKGSLSYITVDRFALRIDSSSGELCSWGLQLIKTFSDVFDENETYTFKIEVDSTAQGVLYYRFDEVSGGSTEDNFELNKSGETKNYIEGWFKYEKQREYEPRLVYEMGGIPAGTILTFGDMVFTSSKGKEIVIKPDITYSEETETPEYDEKGTTSGGEEQTTVKDNTGNENLVKGYLPSVNGWEFSNYSVSTISKELFYRIFDSSKLYNKHLYALKKNAGASGMCEGMALTSALVFKNNPPVTSFGKSGSTTAIQYKDDDKDTCFSKNINMTINEFIQSLWLYQFSKDSSLQERNNKGKC